MFFKKKKKEKPPFEAFVPGIYKIFREQNHLLIGGCSGSGKSVILNGIIYSLLFNGNNRLILIDPKKVELIDYKNLPHTEMYADNNTDIIQALNNTVLKMENIYKDMQKRHIKKYDGVHRYIIIDEFADLMTTCKKQALPLLCRIAQLGRAANIHLFIATQRPTRDIISGQIKVNIDSRIALRCPTAQDSRNIIELSGAENLPKFGRCLYSSPDNENTIKYIVPMVPEEQIHELINYFTA